MVSEQQVYEVLNKLYREFTHDIDSFHMLYKKSKYSESFIKQESYVLDVTYGLEPASSSKYEADIAANQNSMVQSRLNLVFEITMFSKKLENQFHIYAHDAKMRDLLELREVKEQTLIDGRIQEQNIKNEILFHQSREAKVSADTAELNHRAQERAMREQFGHDF